MGSFIVNINEGFLLIENGIDYQLKVFKSDFENHKFLIPSFYFSLCSLVEGSLNSSISVYFMVNRMGNNPDLINFYHRLGFIQKLRIAIPLISNNKFKVNFENEHVNRVIEMFETRNKFIHISNKIIETGKENKHQSILSEISISKIEISNLDKMKESAYLIKEGFLDFTEHFSFKNVNETSKTIIFNKI